MAEIVAIRDQKKNLDIYKVDRRGKRGLRVHKGEGQEMDDEVYENETDDEDKLIAHFVRQREKKAKFAEGIRDRQSRMMELND